MRLVALRGEEPPGNAVVVVRGGVNGLAAETVARSAGRNFDVFGFLGLSVFLAVGRTVEQLCREVPEHARYGQVGPPWPGSTPLASPSSPPETVPISTSFFLIWRRRL